MSEMAGRILSVCLAATLAGAVGCTHVQKGTAAGGALGSGIGALAGHAASGLGSGPGAIIGFGLGAASGAIAADEYYGPEETGDLAVAQANNEDLTRQVEAKDAALAEAQAEAARERAQQKALLQAYEKLRTDQTPAPAAAEAVAAAPAESFTFTISSAALFKSGSATLTSSGKSALKVAARDLRARCPDPQIEVRGHTDNTPIRYSSYKSNWELSVARAQAVVNYMVDSQGFQPSQFTMVGCGDTQPIASNATAEGRQKNRRAELVVQPRRTQVADVR
jgi:flagellar motor protein MotB